MKTQNPFRRLQEKNMNRNKVPLSNARLFNNIRKNGKSCKIEEILVYYIYSVH